MRNPFKKIKENIVARRNIALYPTESRAQGNYVAAIIKKKYYNYYNINHRKAVCELDANAKKLTKVWRDVATAKTFKFYSSHEIDAEEVMQDIRKKWIELNATEIFKKCIVPFTRDGYVLIRKPKLKDGKLDYDVYGEFECPPAQWTRIKNKIVEYKVEYTPRPRGIGTSVKMLNIDIDSSSADQLQIVRKKYSVKEIIHIERGEPNHGYGDPLIEGCWDSIIKLAGDSHYDMLNKRKIPELHLTEDDYDDDQNKAKGMLKMVANSDEDTARVWYHKKDQKGEITDYPKFAYSSASGTVAGGTTPDKSEGISTGDYGNIPKEWMRLCSITGHTIHYFAGNRAGAVTGSESDTDDDINQEIIDFGLLEPIIRKILECLEELGLLTLPKETFVIKYWKDWENIESKKKKEEQMLQQNPNQPNGQLDKPQERNIIQNTQNQIIVMELLNCMKMNMSYPMTSVGSSWIGRIGYWEPTEKLYMELLSGKVYSKPAPLGEWSYLDWAEAGSKGGYFWDYLSQRDPPWQLDALPADLVAYEGFGTPEEMSEYKMSLVGTSREPFTFEMLQREFPTIDWKKIFAEERALFDKLKEEYEQLPEPKTEGLQKLIIDYFGKKNNTINYAIERIPMLDYHLIDKLDTETKIKRLGQANQWSMGTTTATRIKNMLSSLKENANKHQLRYNTLTIEAFGNSIKEGHPLRYDIGNGVIVEEYVCPDAWKENIGKTVPIGIYHNLESNSPELPEWQIVGTAEIFGWDDEEGYDYVKYNYDMDKVDEVFRKLGEYNWLNYVLNEGFDLNQSTAYYCDIDIQWSEKLNKFIRVQTNIDLRSISFVPQGNCPGDICSISVVKHNISEMQKCIKECIASGKPRDQCLAIAYKKFKGK